MFRVNFLKKKEKKEEEENTYTHQRDTVWIIAIKSDDFQKNPIKKSKLKMKKNHIPTLTCLSIYQFSCFLINISSRLLRISKTLEYSMLCRGIMRRWFTKARDIRVKLNLSSF